MLNDFQIERLNSSNPAFVLSMAEYLVDRLNKTKLSRQEKFTAELIKKQARLWFEAGTTKPRLTFTLPQISTFIRSVENKVSDNDNT